MSDNLDETLNKVPDGFWTPQRKRGFTLGYAAASVGPSDDIYSEDDQVDSPRYVGNAELVLRAYVKAMHPGCDEVGVIRHELGGKPELPMVFVDGVLARQGSSLKPQEGGRRIIHYHM
jgi:hypothetical protein